MTSTIRAVADPTLWTATSGCGPGRLPATPTGGGWGWGYCSSAGPREATAPTLARPTPARDGSPSAGGVDAELVGLLASMALAVATRG